MTYATSGRSILTPKQENFCIEYLKTGNASEAYRQAYGVRNVKPETVNRLGKKLIDNVKIMSRVDELRKPAVIAAQITLTKHLTDLEDLRDLAKKEGKYSAAVSAEIARGKASGLYTEQINLTGTMGLPSITITKYAD